jgi:hypothetical protein
MRFRLVWACAVATLIVGGGIVGLQSVQAQAPTATGYVYHDRNRNGVRDPGEPGIRNVRVSNGREIVRTDNQGRWTLPYDPEDTIFFVLKPRGWMTPVNENNLPRFHYIHRPQGSPKLKYEGVPPTGPLPKSIDFALYPQREPDKFRAIFFADTQPRDQREVDYIAHDVVEELIGIDAAFGVTLGDIVFDDLDIFEPLNRVIALIGIPWYNVVGNHDINFDAPNDHHSNATFERIYGPPYYSFDYGPTHFIVLDDVMWSGRTETDRGRYTGGLGPKQIEFVKNDLAMIPKDQLVVLLMHIPLVNVDDRQELYRLMEQRPYVLSVSGHTHYQEHKFITREDGWRGPEPHHHVINVTVSGSWWSGNPDERGIPHTTMRDGAPNGYSIFTFDGRNYSIDFKASRRPGSYQMNVMAPESVTSADTAKTAVLANVFAGSERCTVEMRVGQEGQWVRMKKVSKPDPEYVAVYERDRELKLPYRPLPGPINSPHLWEANLPADLPRGVHPIYVRSRDMFGKVHSGVRSIRVN